MSLCVGCCLVLDVCNAMRVGWHVLFVVLVNSCSLFAVCCSSFVVRWLLLVARCVLFVV